MSRSSTRRSILAISVITTPSTRRTSSAAGRSLRASTSSWPRIAVSGVRSSWEASETNWRWREKASSRRSSMWSKASARVRTSTAAEASEPIRGVRSPASTAAAVAAMRRSGAAVRAASR